MSTSKWTGAVSSVWDDADNWSPAGVPDASSDVVIARGAPVAIASASIGTVNSITDSSRLSFESAGTNTVTTVLDDTGHLKVDAKGGEGGTTLDIGGTLTNSGDLHIGNATLSASDEVTAASLDNAGSISLTGAGASRALLDVTAGVAGFGTAGVLSGYARLAGDSAIEFASGEITSLAASAHLGLVGSDAFIEDSTAPGSNSALTGLASIGDGALFALHDGASVSTTAALVNDGNVYLDPGSRNGGSSLTVGGTLTNSGTLNIGNTKLSASDEVTAASLDNTGRIYLTGAGANQALLDVTTGSAGFDAAGVLSGYVQLAGDSAIEFLSGQISTIAAGSGLALTGTDAFIEDSTAPGSNSALTGLASIGDRATFELHDQAAVSTTGALVNDGTVYLDPNRGDGGSSVTLAGALTNSGTLGVGNSKLSASDKVTTASLDNTGKGAIYLTGSSANQALLDVTTGAAGFGAAGVLSGAVFLGSRFANNDESAIEFASGQITSLAAGAQLVLYGKDAFVEDSTALGSNSALTGLADVAGTLDLENGASLSTTGALTNTGTIYLTGSGANQALLDVPGSAGFGTAGTLTGNVNVGPDSAIEFLSGQISTIAAGSALGLVGAGFVEDSTALGSNSALAGLANVAGSLNLEKGAVSTTGALVNSGSVYLDQGGAYAAGSTLSIGGALTNTGRLDMGWFDLGSSDSVTANSFVNSGTVDLTGELGGAAEAALNVSGATTNNGSISINFDTEELAGAVGGSGSFSLLTANLRFDSSVSPGQTINETGADKLILEQAQSFAATISGFGAGDTIDATSFVETGTTYNFVENSAMTGGTLTLTDTSLSLTANILMTGDYSNKSFTLAPDSGTGTLVKFA